ncbi:uncharacterized protein LOC143503279 [Brachyhypopomus gauderio]|uniref:uncharacterized protein LOC143503279 n=1 Tax=Brachyhypopomus gauderio TaxID=698409 RepID=UPI004041623A
MATNSLKGSPSVPETLPPKKRNQSDISAEPIFKTPSPFWRQNGSRRHQEPVPLSLLDLHSANTYTSLWPEMTYDPNPVLAHTLGNVAFPTWGHNFVSYDCPMTWSDSDRSDPVTRSFWWAPSHWNYTATEPREPSAKNHPGLHNQCGPPVIKPVPQSFMSQYSSRVLNRDAPRGEEMRPPFQEERWGAAQWEEKPYVQRAPHRWRARRNISMKQGPPPLTEPGAELAQHKNYSELRNSPQPKVAKTGDLHHQKPSGAYPSCSNIEQLKSRSEVHTRNELPLMAMSGNAESQKLRETTLNFTRLMSCFVEGSLIELAGGKLKRVEDLKMEDFEHCTELCPELSLRRFTVQKITCSRVPGLTCLEVELQDDIHSKMCLEVCEEYPLFVCARGWSSCRPERTARLCCLRCLQLHPGDVCLALTPTPTPPAPPTQPDADEEREDCTERSGDTTTLGKPRRRHSSAPQLRNVSQHQTRLLKGLF